MIRFALDYADPRAAEQFLVGRGVPNKEMSNYLEIGDKARAIVMAHLRKGNQTLWRSANKPDRLHVIDPRMLEALPGQGPTVAIPRPKGGTPPKGTTATGALPLGKVPEGLENASPVDQVSGILEALHIAGRGDFPHPNDIVSRGIGEGSDLMRLSVAIDRLDNILGLEKGLGTKTPVLRPDVTPAGAKRGESFPMAVSYTHLKLPTIYSV